MASPPPSESALEKRRAAAFAFCAYVLLVAPIAIYSFTGDGFWPYRFYVWAAAPVLLLLAYALTSIRGKTGVAVGVVAVAAMTAGSLWGRAPPMHADYRSTVTIVADGYVTGDYLFCFPYPNCAAASGYYLPEELPLGGGFIDETRQGPLMAFFPAKADWFDAFLHQRMSKYKDDLVPVTGLRAAVNEALIGHDRLWLVFGYGDDCPGCDEFRSYLLSDWREAGAWSSGDNRVYLYIRNEN